MPPCAALRPRRRRRSPSSLAGCSGEEEAPERPASERLAAAKAAFDAARTVALDLSSRDVPPRENGVTAAKGSGVISATEPQFEGTITGTVGGVAGTIDVIAIGDTTYLKLFTPDYEETDLDTAERAEPRDVLRPGRRHLRAAARRPSTPRTRARPARAARC